MVPVYRAEVILWWELPVSLDGRLRQGVGYGKKRLQGYRAAFLDQGK